MARYRPRKEVKMWLYLDKPEEGKLVEFVTYLKQTRKLAQAVRNGLRLLWSLGEGDTSVLFELFPHLEGQLAARFTPPPLPDTGNLERKLERIEKLVLEQGRINPDAPMVAAPALKSLSAGVGSTLGQGRKLALPLVDDDDEETIVVTKTDSGKTNSENMMASMMAIMY